MRQTPNFSGWRATILHRSDSNTERLIRQLRLLGFSVGISWDPLSDSNLPDLVLVDADQGWDGLLPWSSIENASCPVVALLGSEAPSRIAWAMNVGAGAILAKPLSPSAVYPSLVMSIAIHEERKAVRERMDHYEERIRMRPLVHGAVKALMASRKLSEEDAYAALRSNAMRRRVAMESIAASFLAGTESLPEFG
ncbi:MAG: ANTAR domain-containing protein [Rhizobiaceae bacterium]